MSRFLVAVKIVSTRLASWELLFVFIQLPQLLASRRNVREGACRVPPIHLLDISRLHLPLLKRKNLGNDKNLLLGLWIKVRVSNRLNKWGRDFLYTPSAADTTPAADSRLRSEMC